MESNEIAKVASQVRRDIVRMVAAVSSGHPGGSLGCADFLSTLYFDTMNHNPTDFKMDGTGEDLFFLSNGHISPVWYSVLARSNYFPVPELATFRKLGTRLQGHPSTDHHLPGIRMASGSLGQGLSVGIGAAATKKLNGDDSLVYTLHGDGEMQEGQIWEAALYASWSIVTPRYMWSLSINVARWVSSRTSQVVKIGFGPSVGLPKSHGS